LSDALAHEGPPHGITLFAFAAISADLAEGDRSATDVLQAKNLTLEQWTEATAFWGKRMAEDARPDAQGNVTARVALTFSDTFAQAQDAKKALPSLRPEDWADLVEDAEAFGLQAALARWRLGIADHARLVRHWARRLASDPVAREAYEARRDEAGRDRPRRRAVLLGKREEGV
jgi:hypothetical protein